jgi:hypothetical protein
MMMLLSALERARPSLGGPDAQAPAVGQRHAAREVPLFAERVDQAQRLAHGCGDFALAALEAVELLDHRDRQHDLVVLEAQQRFRIVNQDIGVDDVDLLHLVSSM